METKYYCFKCDKDLKYKSRYELHLQTYLHKTGKRKPRCDKQEKKDYRCDHCEYSTPQKKLLKNHVLCNHKTFEDRKNEYDFFCEVCDYGSFDKKQFDKHLETKKHKNKSHIKDH